MKLTWITRDGKELSVKKMDDQHIANCIKMLKDKRSNNLDGEIDATHIRAFKKEQKKREYKLLLSRVADIEARLRLLKLEDVKGGGKE